MVLEALEDAARTSLAEESHVSRGTLTIEHVLPQKWQAHWPLDSDDPEAVGHRERMLHSLGNLTLVNGQLNPKLSNGTWEEKREELSAHTVLHLNKELLAAYSAGTWDEETIRSRGKTLAARALRIWPPPSALKSE